MGKVKLLIPEINRIDNVTQPNLKVQYNFLSSDGIVGGGLLTVKTSSSEDFSGAVASTPASYSVSADNGTTWTVVNGNVLDAANLANLISINVGAIGANSAEYFKIVYTEGSNVYESSPMLFTSFTQIVFTLTNTINNGPLRPRKVFVSDRINAVASGATYMIKVEVTNNAFDAAPVWENMTAAYLAKTFYQFSNLAKTNANWGIAVRYTITKQSTSDSIEMTDFSVSWV